MIIIIIIIYEIFLYQSLLIFNMCIKVAPLSYENPEHSDTPKQARNTFKTTTTKEH